ncbi:MAG: haloalkane dehalogenase, partial [Promethearchaeota archaeon]
HRTPEHRFKNLDNYPFTPNYITVNDIRIHYVDEGPKDAEPILLMHGEPSWSYLYRNIIPALVKEGFRVLAPDLVGFGKSDKPAKQSDYTYASHLHWIQSWLDQVDLNNITMFCQDWGSLIGLRLAVANKDRFKRIILANGGMNAPRPGSRGPPKVFLNWRKFSQKSPILPIGYIMQRGTYGEISREVKKAYNAPFPGPKYKAGARIFPSLVPIYPDEPEAINNIKAWDEYGKWDIPFLTAFSDKDPITRRGAKIAQKLALGAKDREHPIVKNAGHFLQEEKPEEIVKIILEFIKNS